MKAPSASAVMLRTTAGSLAWSRARVTVVPGVAVPETIELTPDECASLKGNPTEVSRRI
jgi:hypothetical protein